MTDFQAGDRVILQPPPQHGEIVRPTTPGVFVVRLDNGQVRTCGAGVLREEEDA